MLTWKRPSRRFLTKHAFGFLKKFPKYFRASSICSTIQDNRLLRFHCRVPRTAAQSAAQAINMVLIFRPCFQLEPSSYARRHILSGQSCPHQQRPGSRPAATRGSDSPNEEVLERLRRAEAEAAQLRKEIAAARVGTLFVGALLCRPNQGYRFKSCAF